MLNVTFGICDWHGDISECHYLAQSGGAKASNWPQGDRR